MERPDNHALHVETAQLTQLLAASMLGIVISSTLAVALAYVQQGHVSNDVLIIWLIAVLLVALLRSMWIYSVQKKLSKLNEKQIKLRLGQFRVGTLLAGLTWGLSGCFLLQSHGIEQMMILFFMLAGLSSGGVATYSIDLTSTVLYVTSILLPAAVSLLFIKLEFPLVMSFSIIAYLLFLITSVRHSNTETIDNILLRIDGDQKDNFIKAVDERYYLLLEHLPMGVFHFNKNKMVTFCNKQLAAILKDSSYFNEGANLNYLSNKEMLESLETVINDGRVSQYEGVYDKDLKNPEQWVSILGAPNKNSKGEVSGGIGIMQDITERKQTNMLVERLALQDYLTELPNRRMLMSRMQLALDNNAKTHADIALMYVDLDNFKALNDSLGHAVGDLLLQQVAKRLLKSLGRKDTVARAARIGGDEFVILLESLSTEPVVAAKQVEKITQRILAKLTQPFRLEKHEYQCSVSMGVALYNAHKGSVDDFLRYADIAMYEAKKIGGIARIYDASMLARINKRENLKIALTKAIKNKEFELYYQVQVNALQNPIGAEALIRWNRPGYGSVLPLEFISLAEETGLIIPIGLLVLDKACGQLSQWNKSAMMRKLTIAINVSIQQLMEPQFATEVKNTIKQYAINPTLLKIEVTESMFLDNAAEVINTMQALQKLGVGFELDDFGTGYSCLQYLKQLPLKQLKIDQSFVRDIVKDRNDQSIVKTIIAMSQGFNIDVIAEGVETKAQYTLLGRYGCQHFQGYYFGKPVPIDAFETALRERGVAKVKVTSE